MKQYKNVWICEANICFNNDFFGCNLSSVDPLECVSVNNQECIVRPEIVDVNSNEPVFYRFTIKTSKCSGSCNNIKDLYANFCVTDFVKNMNIKVFNLVSRTNETRNVKWHETCKCNRRLDASVCNSKRRWNKDKCRCECKELIDKEIYDIGFIQNPSNCECDCDKSCDVGEYLDYAHCKCRKRLIDKLVEECTDNIDKVKIAGMALFECGNECKASYTIYVVLITIVFTNCIAIGTYFIYYKDMNHDKKNCF